MYIKEKGITLITLTVTLIVMLILAGVAVNLSVGDQGIIGETQNALDEYQNVANQEQESANQFADDFNQIFQGSKENISDKPTIEIFSWNNDGAKVQISEGSSYTTQYRIGNETWKTYQGEVVPVPNGEIIYARYIDSEENVSQVVSKIIKDVDPPTITAQITNSTANTIEITAAATDDEIGMLSEIIYKYYIKAQSDSNYEYKGQNNTGKYTFENLSFSITYDIMITANDIAGNTGSVKLSTQTTEGEPPSATLTLTNITTKSITAELSNITSSGEGMPTTPTFNYYIKKKTDNNYPTTPKYSGPNTSYKFEELDHDTEYDVKVTFENKAGIEGSSQSQATTLKVPDLTNENTTFTLSDENITNKSITVEIKTNVTGYTLQYSLDGTNYQEYTSKVTIDKNTTIYARLWDDRNDTGNFGDFVEKQITNIDTSLSDLEILIKKDEFVEENTEVTDDNENKITIPEGFKPTNDASTIDKGVVIEDREGNQFVWIPVGDIKTTDGSTVTIDYDRYVYASWKTNGTDSETNSMKIQTTIDSTEYFKERLNETEKNSAVQNGGFYLGRYEAGTTAERTENSDIEDTIQIKEGAYIYNWIDYTNSKSLAQGMYTSENYTSRLTSSYAWDTALKFLEKTGNNSYLTNSTQGNYYNTNYGDKGGANSNVLLKSGQTQKVNNIYDLGGNVYEWTTEGYSKEGTSNVARGGFFGFNSSDEPVIGRLSTKNTKDSAIGFRVALFIGKVEKDKSSLEIARDNQTEFSANATLEDDEGKTLTVPGGFKVSQDSDILIKNGVVIEEIGKGNEYVWVPVDSLDTMVEKVSTPVKLSGVETTTDRYSKLRIKNGNISEGIPGNETVAREPDIVTSVDTSENFYNKILGFKTTKEMADVIVQEYKDVTDSIEEYHGFYIGRYELTGDITNPTEKEGTPIISQNWYNLYNACKNITSNNYSQSTMIWGFQWDETCSWLNKNGYDTEKDSSSWGNLGGNQSSQDTGKNDKWQANKIYDLAGNYYEMTQEANGNRNRTARGGYSSNTGTAATATMRMTIAPNTSSTMHSTRATLYIKKTN